MDKPSLSDPSWHQVTFVEDEYEMFDDRKNRKLTKEKLIVLFTDHLVENVLPQYESNAIV